MIRHNSCPCDRCKLEEEELENVTDRDEDQPRRRRLSRQEQLEELADSGVDTWEEYRGEN